MWTVEKLKAHLRAPIIGSPMFIANGIDLVVEQCCAGIIGTFPALNAREDGALDQWLTEIKRRIAEFEVREGRKAAPFGVNLIVHESNIRLAEDLDILCRHRVPLVITSLSAPGEVVRRVHEYGGLVYHDVINMRHARKAAGAGVDGLILVAAGAGGHAGRTSPFALVEEARQFFDGTLILAGAISSGRGVLAAEAMGCDFAYIGTLFLATNEAQVAERHKEMVVESAAINVVYTPMFSGTHGNYLEGSIAASGIDPAEAARAEARKMNFGDGHPKPKAWRDIYGAGHGVGTIMAIEPVKVKVDRLVQERNAALAQLQTLQPG